MNENKAKTILLVDDDADYLFQQRKQLEEFGYSVATAENAPAALATFESAQPDVVVLDLMMEDMDSGFILAKKIKNRNPSVPIILLTGVSRETGRIFDRGWIDDGGWNPADRVLSKPIRSENLKREIERLLALGV